VIAPPTRNQPKPSIRGGKTAVVPAVKPTDQKGAQDMKWTLSVAHIPASNEVLLLVGIFLNPCQFGGGGSLSPTP
jgi:hypothetical protein